jgi:hypothetical protein
VTGWEGAQVSRKITHLLAKVQATFAFHRKKHLVRAGFAICVVRPNVDLKLRSCLILADRLVMLRGSNSVRKH